ncbi:MAG TPA: MltA domain-containing protein [Phycisphaerales bacterium]|nr:MltA domain-containing protein [Phycisphaerales bacterium]
MHIRLRAVSILASACFMLTGCNSTQVAVEQPKPDYTHQLPPGASALRLITDPSRMPDIAAACNAGKHHVYLAHALDESIAWFNKPSSKTFFPFQGFSHEQAMASVYAMRDLLKNSSDEQAFVDAVKSKFDVYESVGYNNQGIVLFTGYYSPEFRASLVKTPEFSYPLYKRPADLVTDPNGKPLGRKRADGTVEPYPTRKEIESSGMLRGTELVWLPDALSAYIIHVNGSAQLRMPDGSLMYIGYAGKTDRAYKGLGASMVEAGLINKNDLSLPAIRRVYRENPQRVQELMNNNECYVFFAPYDGKNWPAGSLGQQVSAEATLATDKSIYPRGGIVLVDTDKINFSNAKVRFQSFMLDQDTGGAIRAPGRADIYMGVGSSAEILAGGQYAEGRLYYFFLKDHYVDDYLPAAKK